MKKTLKKLLTGLMSAALLIPVLLTGNALNTPTFAKNSVANSSVGDSASASSADTREEVVYALLSPSGDVKTIHVVNILSVKQAGYISDFGSYTDVKNLTNTESIVHQDDRIAVRIPSGVFYYQGTMNSTALPWNISITYYLDGKELPANAIAGKTGKIGIQLVTSPNPDVNPSYFDNYLLQISVTLDTSKCKNIAADGGTTANAGKNKLITFAVMPGKSGDMMLTADVTDFSMAGIDLAAVPLSMKIDPPDTSNMLADLKTLSDGVAALNDGVAQLKDGTQELKAGAAELKGGSSSFAGGLSDLYGSSADLIGGSAEIMNALDAIASSMNGSSPSNASGGLNLGELSTLPDGLSQLAAGLDGISSGFSDLKTGFTAAYAGLDTAVLEIPDSTVSEEELSKLYQDNPDKKDSLDKLVAFYASAGKVKGTYLAVKPAFDAVGSSIDQLTGSIGQISGTLKSLSAQIKSALESNDTVAQMAQLTAGLSELSANYNKFHEGLVSYTAGVGALKGNYAGLHDGISGITGGIDELYGGISETYAGTSELNDGLKDMPDKVDEEISSLLDEYDKSDYLPVSFVSENNINTESVQFVLKTEKIEKPEAPAPAPEPVKAETIWDRFLDLFK